MAIITKLWIALARLRGRGARDRAAATLVTFDKDGRVASADPIEGELEKKLETIPYFSALTGCDAPWPPLTEEEKERMKNNPYLAELFKPRS